MRLQSKQASRPARFKERSLKVPWTLCKTHITHKPMHCSSVQPAAVLCAACQVSVAFWDRFALLHHTASPPYHTAASTHQS